ncbi:Lrp/AsnC family transcriptional regulator [archaeon]|jgi:Lrp/AsnC family transcriptional regulator, leucine-responsive regulatory protein|nr:Lrp/AsnC family transcriptional regulator [Candidatus Cloacimonadota bacterium]MBT6762890.1 Lrp/AsnC family transcriptional regulator [archaeon]
MTDLIDRKLLYELNWNARQTHTAIAKKLRVSKQVVSYRIKQLEKQKIIKSYHAVIDWRKLGYNAIRIYLKWQNIDLKKEEEVYEEIRKDPLFMWSIRFEGDIDIAFYVWVKSIPEFAKKWFEFISKYKKYILKYEIYESVDMVHYPMKFLIDKYKAEELIIGREEKVKFDDTDYEILKIVTEHGQTPITDIARRIKLTPKAAMYRLRNLQKKEIILGYYALLDETKLGYVFYKVDFYLNDMSKIKEMNEYAKQHKNVVYRMRTIGGPDFEIEVVVKDVIEMKKIINEIREKFPNKINNYRFHRFEYSIKQIYLPGENIEK